MKEVYLYDLASPLQKTHVKLNLDFLNKLLKNASKSDRPHRNQKFAKEIGCPLNKNKKSAMTIYGWMVGYRTVPLLKLMKIIPLSNYNWNDVQNNLLTIKAGISRGEISPNFPIKVDERLGSIIGHILGDGSIDKRFHRLFYSNSNIELLKEFRSHMKQIFGREPFIWVQKKNDFIKKTEWLKKVKNLNEVPIGHNVGLFYPKICSDILYVLFDKFAEGKNKKITNQIFNTNLDFKKGLVRAFFDDEGSVRADNRTVRFHQDNKELLYQMRLLIHEFGISTHTIKYYVKRDKPRHYFNINGFREYYNFYHKIGCISSKKNQQFQLLINQVQNSKYFKKKYAL